LNNEGLTPSILDLQDYKYTELTVIELPQSNEYRSWFTIKLCTKTGNKAKSF